MLRKNVFLAVSLSLGVAMRELAAHVWRKSRRFADDLGQSGLLPVGS